MRQHTAERTPDTPTGRRTPTRRMPAPQPPRTTQVLTSGTGQHPTVAQSPPMLLAVSAGQEVWEPEEGFEPSTFRLRGDRKPGWRRTPTPNCCLEDVSAPSGEVCRVLSSQVRSGAESGQAPDVGSGYGRWNDAENDIGREQAPSEEPFGACAEPSNSPTPRYAVRSAGAGPPDPTAGRTWRRSRRSRAYGRRPARGKHSPGWRQPSRPGHEV
jgi:hypothetical protein